MSGEMYSNKTSKFSNSSADTEERAPRPSQRMKLNPPVVPPKGMIPHEDILSAPPPLPERNSHINLTSPGVSSTIEKFENVTFDHKNPTTFPRVRNKASHTKLHENNSPIIPKDNNQSAHCSKMNNLYEDIPVHDANNHSRSLLRSESVQVRSRNSYPTGYNRHTSTNVLSSTAYGNQKYMDLYSLLPEEIPEEINDDQTTTSYRAALDKLQSAEQEYYFQLQKIIILFDDNRSKYSAQTLDMNFGDIRALFNFHEKMLKDIKICDSMPELAKLIMDNESEYDIYIKDKWLKVTKAEKNIDIYLPYNNWAETHLEFYKQILKRLVQYKNPAIIMAYIIINETIDQLKAVEWLSEIEDFPTKREAGLFILKDNFKIKDNGKDKGTQEVLYFENYILCVSSVKGIKKCLLSFKVADITITLQKKKSNVKSLKINIVGAKKSTILKSPDSKTIDIWNHTYLEQVHLYMLQVKHKKKQNLYWFAHDYQKQN